MTNRCATRARLNPTKRQGGCCCGAFTLMEMMLATAITAMMVVMMSAVISASLDTMAHTTRSVRHHDDSNQVLRVLREDLRGLRVLEMMEISALWVEQAEDGSSVRIALVRPDARTHGVDEQGYYRHVEYTWNAEDGLLVRTVFHAADDARASERTRSTPDGSDHAGNLARLAGLTPALAQHGGSAWWETPAFAAARHSAKSVPLMDDVARLEVRCFPVWTGDEEHGFNPGWQDPGALPEAVRVDIQTRSTRKQGLANRATLLIPVSVPYGRAR